MEGHLRLRLFPGHESVSGPRYLWRSDVGPWGRISLGDRDGRGKESVSGGQRGLAVCASETEGRRRGKVLFL